MNSALTAAAENTPTSKKMTNREAAQMYERAKQIAKEIDAVDREAKALPDDVASARSIARSKYEVEITSKVRQNHKDVEPAIRDMQVARAKRLAAIEEEMVKQVREAKGRRDKAVADCDATYETARAEAEARVREANVPLQHILKQGLAAIDEEHKAIYEEKKAVLREKRAALVKEVREIEEKLSAAQKGGGEKTPAVAAAQGTETI